MEKLGTKIMVEYECTPIRHIAVQCPFCKNWFKGHDILKDNITYSCEIDGASCSCPKCNYIFDIDMDGEGAEIKEPSTGFNQFVNDNCLKKVERWE